MDLSPTPIVHVSVSLPAIPGGRISPAEAGLAAMAFPPVAFLTLMRLKCRLIYTPPGISLLASIDPNFNG